MANEESAFPGGFLEPDSRGEATSGLDIEATEDGEVEITLTANSIGMKMSIATAEKVLDELSDSIVEAKAIRYDNLREEFTR